MAQERLQKTLAAAGLGSRRKCEQMIAEGRVTVDGRVVSEMGVKVDPAGADIRCDGARVRPERKVYMLVNKPKGYICTSGDEMERPRVIDLLPDRVRERLFAVGRLDEDSEGLIILTNDGEFANLVTHPRYGLRKTYLVVVPGQVSEDTLAKISKGVWLAEGRTAGANVKVIRCVGGDTVLHVTIGEGRNREIRRVFGRFDHKVKKLMRINIGGLADEALKPGRCRPLRREEIEGLRARALRSLQGKGQAARVPMGQVREEIKKRYDRADKARHRFVPKGEKKREGFHPERRDQPRFRHGR